MNTEQNYLLQKLKNTSHRNEALLIYVHMQLELIITAIN